jgi:TolB protein
MNRRTLVLTIALLVAALSVTGCDLTMGGAAPTPTVVPLAATRASDTPTVAPTPTLLKAPTATPVPPKPTPTPPLPTATLVPKEVSAPPVAAMASATVAAQATLAPTPELTGKLVFQVCNGCDIYVINADGSGLRRLTDGMDPAWSPDGKKVAFARWRDPRGIYVIDEDGSNETLLFGWSQAKAPAWSPDGSRIAFTRQYGGQEKDITIHFWTIPAHPWWKLGLVRVEDRTFTELLCYDHSFSPTWSPDGKVIAYDSDYGLHLTSEDGSIGGQSYKRSLDALSTDVRDTSPAWSPLRQAQDTADGSKIAFMFNQHDHWEIYVMDADGSNRVRLTREEPFTGRAPNNVSPAWSPDGRHIAFFTDRSSNSEQGEDSEPGNSELKWELYVMNADGSDQRPMFDTVLDGLPIEYGFVAERMVSWTK